MSESFDGNADRPKCGLYRTGIPLEGKEDSVAAERLVFFHNHSEQGPPLVLMPSVNEHNRWQFHDRGYLVESPGFLENLVPLRPEGFYILKGHVHVGRDEIIPERALVQLGYNRKAEPILFMGRFEGNTIVFPTTGYRFDSLDLFDHLEPAGFLVPKPKESLH
jgi:hypothetical protein